MHSVCTMYIIHGRMRIQTTDDGRSVVCSLLHTAISDRHGGPLRMRAECTTDVTSHVCDSSAVLVEPHPWQAVE